MALPIPTSAQYRGGALRNLHLRLSSVSVARGEEDVSEGNSDLLPADLLRDESPPAPDDANVINSECGPDTAENEPAPVHSDDIQQELERLRAENERLTNTVARLEQVLAEQDQMAEAPWVAKEKEYESLLDEKSEVIRSLHAKMLEMQEKPSAETPREEELLALSEELERERAQLKEDEEALMKQMREMEVQMSRERAEVARQRIDLDRLQKEFHHELETAARDIALRQRLAPLQRRQQELVKRPGRAPEAAAAEEPPDEPEEAPAPPVKEGGLLRRLFR